MDSKIRIKTAALKDRCAKGVKTIWIRPIVYGLLSLFLIPLSSCRQNNWVDWKTQNEIWLENNKKQPGVVLTSTGLQYRIIADPTPQDAQPNSNSTVVCDYSVKLINGYVVDRGNSVTLNLANTIPGFSEGCHKVHNNGDIELFIPAYLGYDYSKYNSNDYYNAEGLGTEGSQSFIPPYSTLIYTVHICSVSL